MTRGSVCQHTYRHVNWSYNYSAFRLSCDWLILKRLCGFDGFQGAGVSFQWSEVICHLLFYFLMNIFPCLINCHVMGSSAK
mmetsp:Transcript_22551/g.42056  ORF Transcript_22551/g.42056 Transcript_22551/m.42056 type:complete len:81 (-) Transcript_22551:42-284(-)